jgi:sigma-B regulation protein RsbU (phosphoserine phosphatase)
MPTPPRSWQDELAIVDRTMRAISGITDPEELVGVYWENIGELMPINDYLSVSRRDVEPPFYLVTRSSRFTESINPWTQRDRLPKFSGGLVGEIAYANRPMFIDNLASRLHADEPAREYLEGFDRLVALPQYDQGDALNVTMLLLPSGVDFDVARIPVMHWQSGLFGRGTQNLVLRNRLAIAHAALDREIQTVGDIQRSLLPKDLPQIPGFEMAACYQTSARAGGDYYDFFPLPGGAWGLFIADVSGHGTPAAVLMAITHAIAHARPGTHTPPEQLLTYLNSRLATSYTRAGTFVTAFYAVLDPAARTLTYSLAGHNPPRLIRGGARAIPLDQNAALPLGILEGERYEQATIALEPNDLLLLYTDGITEAMTPPAAPGASRDLFGPDRLDQVLIDCAAASPRACIARVRAEVAAFTHDAPPNDDRTLIAIRCAQWHGRLACSKCHGRPARATQPFIPAHARHSHAQVSATRTNPSLSRIGRLVGSASTIRYSAPAALASRARAATMARYTPRPRNAGAVPPP